MFRIALLLVAALSLSACDVVSTVTESLQQARAAENDLEQSTGVKPEVGFNWHNGRLTAVTVAYPRLYESRPLTELAGLVRTAVTRDFKRTPESIVLSFALGK
jgi:hypothetical protein